MMRATYEIVDAPLESIRINGGTQSRAELNEATIAEYAEAIRNGIDLPPVVTFFDGVSFWLADGFHRYWAHKAASAMEISSEIREGTCRDAVLFSVGANAAHGLRRTNEDKRRAVMTLLNDPEWAAWSDNAIAKACGVSQPFVSGLRSVTSNVISDEPIEKTFTTKHGTTATMQTANIGKAKPAAAPTAPDDDEGTAPDMAQLAGELQTENEAMQRQIRSLESDDTNAELVRLNTHLDKLNGRLQGEITTRNEAQRMVSFYAALLTKIRKAVNVENNADILAALGKK